MSEVFAPEAMDESQAQTPRVAPENDLGADLVPPDTSSDDTEGADGHADDTTQQRSTEEAVDLLRVNPDELPEHLQAAAQLARQMRADYTRKTQDLADQRRQLEQQVQQERQQYLDALQRVQPRGEAPQADPMRQIQEQLSTLPEQDRQGAAILLQAVEQAVNARVEAALQPLRELPNTVQGLQQSLQGLTQQQQHEVSRQMQAEVRAAQEAYGEDTVQQYADILVRSYGSINPTTGEPFSLSELVGRLSGQQAQQTAQTRQAGRQAQRQSKAKARAAPTTTSPEGNGQLSEEEAIAQIGALFGD